MSTTTSSTAATATTDFSFLNTKSATTAVSTAKEQSDRFLKLLTTQLQNQDPMNPMDNAQMTSQMAQISTVSGVETLNASIQALSSQFVQMQALQGAALVGRDVLVAGNHLTIADGVGKGAFDLDAAAGQVKVEVLNAAGGVVDTVQLGAKTAGRNSFQWKAGSLDDSVGYTFRVTATGSGGSAVKSTALALDHVNAVNTGGTSLQLQLQRGGSVGYDSIKALN